MRTYHEYDPEDIDLKADPIDPVHSFLMTQMLIIGLTGFKPQDTDPEGDAMFPIKRQIAQFLNAAQRSGIVVAKGEAVPDVYRAVQP